MRNLILFLLILASVSCSNQNKDNKGSDTHVKIKQNAGEEEQDDTTMISFRVLDSKILEKKVLLSPFEIELFQFTKKKYDSLKPLILEKNLEELQANVAEGVFNYEDLTLFYLYRIREIDRENNYSLNSIVNLNSQVLTDARLRDRNYKNTQNKSLIYGIPVLLKDNINTASMATTAGALALEENTTASAYITNQLQKNGALILGKANMSELGYYFCEDCPSGYSTIGGQTFNPYGRRTFDTGGSSSGSAVAVAANLAPVSVGTETVGSILSPASQNSVVGLKPTVGLISRNGILPISKNLDTPGSITKTVADNAILLSAMAGRDTLDTKYYPDSLGIPTDYYTHLKDSASVNGVRFGVIESLKNDSLYAKAIEDLKKAGAQIVTFTPKEVDLTNFTTLLDLDMKKDLNNYLDKFVKRKVNSIEEILEYNQKDKITRIPYGQSILESVVKTDTSIAKEKYEAIRDILLAEGQRYFKVPMKKYNLDAVLSINNYHAGYAAAAEYPAITVPMGYKETGEPVGLTIISVPYSEQNLLRWAYIYEKATQQRKPPKDYMN
ncbi:amidase family protein [Zunongwangia sp.]|uniref:amidase family protein n=1 Tax=Zunongwangia sp. TaxID=1965325 RepID=UPI003AA8A4EC